MAERVAYRCTAPGKPEVLIVAKDFSAMARALAKAWGMGIHNELPKGFRAVQEPPPPVERPILFSSPMVRAILAGTKTQTRRVLKPQPNAREHVGFSEERGWHTWMDVGTCPADHGQLYNPLPCRYVEPGDRLWVRETWMPGYAHGVAGDGATETSYCEVIYKADNASLSRPAPDDVAERWESAYSEDGPGDENWRPSIHMPRWASRITLEVTGVRVERLQQISDDDARAEGTQALHIGLGNYPVAAFRATWENINGAESWAADPWVWVVEFKRLEVSRG